MLLEPESFLLSISDKQAVPDQGRACHLFRDGRGVKHVRQTLTDVGACIGNVERSFPDGRALPVRLLRENSLWPVWIFQRL
jgi:hypothetical protein